VRVTRRKFLKMSGALTGYLLTGPSLWGGGGLPEAYADVGPKTGVETTTICCFCACGCGAIVTATGGKVVAVEGDPDHPVNEGTLCSKGQAQYQTVNQRFSATKLNAKYPIGAMVDQWKPGKRLGRCLYRAAGSSQWQVVDWTFALNKAADLIYNTRAAGFTEHDGTMTVNRCDNIAALGGAAHDNEECYLMRKLWTGLGLVNIDHQARI
jgi:formate dehydrogenase major subunit